MTSSGARTRGVGVQQRKPWWLLVLLVFSCDARDGGSGAAPTGRPTAGRATATRSLAEALPGPPGSRWAARVATLVHECAREGLAESLLARAASLELANAEAPLEHHLPLAQVLAHCEPQRESLLSSWLENRSGRGRAAARALGALAAKRRRLDPASIVALLRRPDLEESWFALSQLDLKGASQRTHLTEQAKVRLEATTPRPYWVVRALGNGDTSAAIALAEIAGDGRRETSLRIAALNELAAFGAVGRDALLDLLPLDQGELALAAVSALRPFEQRPPALDRLLEAVRDDSKALPLRCAIESKTRAPREFRACPEDAGRLHQLAWLEAFEAREADADRPSAKFRQLLEASDPLVVERALAVFERFPARPELDEGLRLGLAHQAPGVVGTAARVLASLAGSHPSSAPSRETVQALKQALLGPEHGSAVATRVALLDAVSALHVLSLKGALPALCESNVTAVRLAVDRALLGMRGPPCEGRPLTATPPEPAEPRPLRLDFHVGDAVLHIDLAPTLPGRLRARLLELVQSGAWKGTPVVLSPARDWIRLGDPEGDDFPNGTLDALTSAPSGVPFGRFSVTFWQHGIDALAPVLSINLEERPDLDAEHTFVGTASADWAQLRTGSVLGEVIVHDPAGSAPSSGR